MSTRNYARRVNSNLPSIGVIITLLACAVVQNSVASEVSSKKSSSPVQADTQTEFRGPAKVPKKSPARAKMSKQQQQAFAREDLAKRLDIALNDTSISGAIQVTWRSGALGCPQPDMNYTTALVPGVLIMVKVENIAYRYHARPGGEPFHCPDSMVESQYLNSSDI